MSSIHPQHRASLCLFTFADGRRCRTPRISSHPHFCYYHAQKEARARAAESLGKDLAFFFSGDYLSACDLSTALARLVPAVLRGDVKPKTARTVAYLLQILMQSIHISQDEYINAFSTDGWRKSIASAVRANYDYRLPPNPGSAPEPPAPPAAPPAPPQAQPPAAPPSPPPASPAPTTDPVVASSAPDSRTGEAHSVPVAPISPAATNKSQPASAQPQPAASTTCCPHQSQGPRTAAAVSVARAPFPRRRRPGSTSVNPFKINIYNPSRNC